MHTIIDTKQINAEIIRDLASEKANKKLKIWDRIQMGIFLIGAIPIIFILGVLFIDNGPMKTFDLLCLASFIPLMIIGVTLMFVLDNKREKLIKQFSKTLTSNEIAAEYPKYFDKVTKELKERIAKNEFDKEVLDSELQAYKAAQEDIIPE